MAASTNSDLNTIVGSNIRALRRDRKLPMDAVANAIGVSVPGYSKFERGLSGISLLRLQQIAAFFGVSAESLVAMDQNSDVYRNEHEKRSRIQQLRGLVKEMAYLQQRAIMLLDKLDDQYIEKK